MKTRQSNKKRRGFTLMEVLLVLAILVVLGGMVTYFFSGMRQSAYVKAAKTQLNLFKGAIGVYELDLNRYPTKLEDLIRRPSDLENPELWTKPYLEANEIPKDPWGNEYQYTNSGNQYYEIVSFGPDGQQGGDDDIPVTNKLDNQ